MSRPNALKILFNRNRKVTALAKKLGVKLSKRNPKESVMWDCHSIATGGLNVSQVIHELAHWMIAGHKYRQVIDFGLGPGPESGERRRAYNARPQSLNSSHEEALASFLGIVIENALGYNYTKTLRDHSWDGDAFYDPCEDGFWPIIAELTNRGLLQGHMPTAVILPKEELSKFI